MLKHSRHHKTAGRLAREDRFCCVRRSSAGTATGKAADKVALLIPNAGFEVVEMSPNLHNANFVILAWRQPSSDIHALSSPKVKSKSHNLSKNQSTHLASTPFICYNTSRTLSLNLTPQPLPFRQIFHNFL